MLRAIQRTKTPTRRRGREKTSALRLIRADTHWSDIRLTALTGDSAGALTGREMVRCWLLACLTSQQRASVSQGRVSLRQVYVLPHRDRSCRSNFLQYTVHRADQSLR